MADNSTLDPGAGGDTYRSKDRAGVKTSIAALDLNPAGAETLMSGTMPVSGTVTANLGTAAVTNGGTFAVQDSQKIADNAGFTDGTTPVNPIGYIFDEVAGTALTENDVAAARVDSKRAQVGVIEDATTRGQRAAVSAANALKVDGSAVTQPVSGTVTANLGTAAVTNAGTFAVQIAANSSVNAAQVAGTATDVNSGNKSAGTQRVVIATDQPALTNALKVDGSAVTQPVSGTVTANLGTAAVTNAGTFAVQDSQKIVDNAAFTDGTTPVQPAGYVFDEVAGTALTENDAAAARIDSKRAQVFALEDATTRGQRAAVSAANALKVDGSAVTQPVSGTVTASGPLTDTQLRASAVPVDTELPAAAALSDTTSNPTTPMVGSGGMMWDGTQWRRVRASDSAGANLSPANTQAHIPHMLDSSAANATPSKRADAIADADGGFYYGSTSMMMYNGSTRDRVRGDTANGLDVDVTRLSPLVAGAAQIGTVSLTPATAGGLTTFHLISAATTNATNVKASAGQLFGWYIRNTSGSDAKVAFHNTAGTPTAGASVFQSLNIPAGGAANVMSDIGITFSTGIGITTVTDIADAGTTAVALNALEINLWFK